ncbi:MAG: hypothetical protein WDZ69_00645 [Candidatus Pacearchaeota archaeon]
MAAKLHFLKSVVIKSSQLQKLKKIVKIKGILKDIDVNEEDINEAKGSLFQY